MNIEEKKLLRRVERARTSGKLDDWEVCCRRLAEFYSSCGHYEKALEAYKEELSVCEAKVDAAGAANAHRMVGEMYNALGQFAESMEHVNRYLDYARKSRNVVEEQRAQATIGRTYFCWASELKASDSIQDTLKANGILKECRKAYMKSLYICEQELRNIDHRERSEMKARILFNLGLACEVEDDIDGALDYVAKSISICKQESLLSDLHRCYISQSTMYLKQNDMKTALAAIDHACELAKKLPNSNEALVLALLHKSEIYFAMGNYMGARTVLKKAYKLNSPNDEDKKSVESSLKRAILLCDLEEKLASTDEENLLERKTLHEKLGDACCSVKNFKHAIQCYKNMLECALQLGEVDKHLVPCYVSLYQTYRDNKEYDLALKYARKEFEHSKCVPQEAIKSHLAIGEILELCQSDYYEVLKEYDAARKIAEEIADKKLIACVLRKLVCLYRNDGREELADKSEQELDNLGLVDVEDSQSDSELSATDAVHLSDLSDSDEETCRARSARNSSFRVTRNEKGETPLHVAAIKGDLSRARRLIGLGHPVKERDLAGWTPLHEAANHGHVEMVKYLADCGADVNDAGGKDCGGVTPLHDAASCGHFEVIESLLERKASVTVLTDSGETPLECLKAWRERVSELSDDEENTYAKIVNEFQTKLKAAGFQSDQRRAKRPELNSETRRRRLYQEKERNILGSIRDNSELNDTVTNSIHSSRERIRMPDNRMTVDLDLPPSKNDDFRRSNDFDKKRRNVWDLVSPEKPSALPSPESDNASIKDSPPVSRRSKKPVADYRAAIDALRKRPLPLDHARPQKEKSALLDENTYIDNWLEDDLRQNQKQKKRKISDYLERSSVRKSVEDSSDELSEMFYPLDDPVDFPASVNQVPKKPKLQATLISSGFQRIPSPGIPESPPPPAASIVDSGLDMAYNLPSPPLSSVSQHGTTKVRVNVGKHLLLIPVDSAKVSGLAVKWLAEEAGRRYCELEGAEPKLQLKTRDGAMICSTDPISVTFDEDLDCIILGWKTASLTDRYKEAVSKEAPPTAASAYGAYMSGHPDTAIMERLAACDLSKWLDLQYMALTESELMPVFRALRHEKDLRVLNLAGNVLQDSGLESLTQSLQNCSIQELNLRCNNISLSGLQNFIQSLASMSNDFTNSLQIIDFSFNPIGAISEDTRGKLYGALPKLSQLKTDYCDLPS